MGGFCWNLHRGAESTQESVSRCEIWPMMWHVVPVRQWSVSGRSGEGFAQRFSNNYFQSWKLLRLPSHHITHIALQIRRGQLRIHMRSKGDWMKLPRQQLKEWKQICSRVQSRICSNNVFFFPALEVKKLHNNKQQFNQINCNTILLIGYCQENYTNLLKWNSEIIHKFYSLFHLLLS